MVQHNDKWKKKATREYHRKHGTLPVGRGRGRGRGQAGLSEQDPLPGETARTEEDVDGDQDRSDEGSNEDSSDHEQARNEQSKYARRKIESNAWRFESEEPDPYLSNPHLLLFRHLIDQSLTRQSSTKKRCSLPNQTMRICKLAPLRQTPH
jgi:hypothetical protein